MKWAYHMFGHWRSILWPKLDVQVKTAMGKEETLSTAQLDFLLPERFDLLILLVVMVKITALLLFIVA